ncbi:MAG: hypothetical protein AABY07_01230 [Nanoarchaeota archaeon]
MYKVFKIRIQSDTNYYSIEERQVEKYLNDLSNTGYELVSVLYKNGNWVVIAKSTTDEC